MVFQGPVPGAHHGTANPFPEFHGVDEGGAHIVALPAGAALVKTLDKTLNTAVLTGLEPEPPPHP